MMGIMPATTTNMPGTLMKVRGMVAMLIMVTTMTTATEMPTAVAPKTLARSKTRSAG